MIARLLDAGYEVTVWNRTRAKAEPLAKLGATLVDTPAELADCDVVFTMVAGSEDLKAVTFGAGGVLSRTDRAPGVLIDSSTVSAEASDEVRAQADRVGTALLAAPVSGNPSVVRAGRLTVVVSGPAEAFATARPILEALGRGATYVGEGDRARLVKICHNLALGIMAQTLAEITVLAEKGGISRTDFLHFFNDSVMGSMFSRYKTPGAGDARLHADVHAEAAAEGLRPRSRCGGTARRERAPRRPRPRPGAGDDRGGLRRRRLRGAVERSGQGLRAWSWNPSPVRCRTACSD